MEADKSVRTVLGRTVRRPSVVVLAAFGLLVGGSELAAHGDRDSPEAAGPSGATATPEPHPVTGTPTPGATEAPSSDIPGMYDSLVFARYDDGLDPAELPPLAPSRGEGYLPAHTMAPWVWELVGPNWALILDCGPDEGYSVPGKDTPTVFYLVSPGGTAFEVVELPASYDTLPTLVSWSEEDRTARFAWDFSNRGATIDLTTGTVTDLVLPMSSGPSSNVRFLAADAAGHEAWMAQEADNVGGELFAWSPGAGWSRILADQPDLGLYLGSAPGSPDGTAVLLGVTPTSVPEDYYAPYLLGGAVSSRSLAFGKPNFVVYSLETGESARFVAPPSALASGEVCSMPGWLDVTSVGVGCDAGDLLRFSVDGSGTVDRTASDRHEPEPWREQLEATGAADYPGTPLRFESGGSHGIASVSLVDPTGATVVIDASAAPFNYLGLDVGQPAPGLFRLRSWTSGDEPSLDVTIDATTGTVMPTYLLGPYEASIVHFGEATAYRRAWPAYQ